MNGRDRVLCAFSHKEADMVPVGDPTIDAHVAKRVLNREAYTGGGGLVRKIQAEMVHEGKRDEFVEKFKVDTVDMIKALDVDFLICDLMPSKTISTKLEKINEKRWRVYDLGSGFWTEYAYESGADIVMEMDSNIKQTENYDDVEQYLDDLERSSNSIDSGIFENVRYCKEKLGDKFLIGRFPALFPHGMSWYTKFVLMFYDAPEMVQRLFDVFLKRALKYVEAFADSGMDAIYVAGDWADNRGTMVSPALIKQYMMPQVREICNAAHKRGVNVIKHTDGNIMPIADDFFDMGIDAYQSIDPGAGMKLKVVKDLYGERITFFGNVDCRRTLVFGSKDEIASEVRQCIKDGAAGGGYVLTSSNTITAMIPADNFLYMIEAARKYGKYPPEV